jgi:hypothetical protein
VSVDAWECPACHTLNASETHCYNCGAPRPDSPVGDAPAAYAGADLESHPCWCDLVKGPHDTRDHPGGPAAQAESAADLEADAHLKQLELDLRVLTHDWTEPSVYRSYNSDTDGEQDYEDEAMLFEGHGYSKWVDRPDNAIQATYTIGDGLPDQ